MSISIDDNTSAATQPVTIDQIVHINTPLSIKLNDSNFFSWKSQVLLIVEGYDLVSYLLNDPPDPATRNDKGETVINPTYLFWKRQDKLLHAWVRSSLSDSILAQVMSYKTCEELWLALESFFSSNSRARLQELKRQLQNMKKGDSNCTDYLLKIRQLADELSFIRNPVSDDDLVTTAVNGLGSDFASIKSSILTVRCHQSFSLSDLRGLLLAHESSNQTQSEPTTFLAGKPNFNNKKGNNNSSQTRPSNNYNNNSFNPKTNTNSGKSPPFTGGSQIPNSVIQEILALIASGKIRIPCQICQRMGHPTKKCYKRYDKDPDWRPRPQMNFYNSYVSSNSSQEPDASNWILDSGANNHVTNDLNSLNSFFLYKGADKLQIGNGLGLEISHIGSQQFHVANYTIKLKNVLCS
jgi:gag-polypeptide of LTR copia-type